MQIHIGRVYEMLKFYELEPYFLLVDRLRSDCEILLSDEVGLLLIVEVWISLQEFFESVFFWLKFPVLILEHSNGSSCVDDENLSNYTVFYLSVVRAKPWLVVTSGYLDLFMEFEFSKNFLVFLLLVFPVLRHCLIIKIHDFQYPNPLFHGKKSLIINSLYIYLTLLCSCMIFLPFKFPNNNNITEHNELNKVSQRFRNNRRHSQGNPRIPKTNNRIVIP